MDQKILLIEASAMRAWWNADLDLETNLRYLFTRARHEDSPLGWVHADQDLFRCAVAAAMLCAEPGDRAWLQAQMRGLALMTHAIEGAQLGVSDAGTAAEDAVEALAEAPERAYGLLGLWHESA